MAFASVATDRDARMPTDGDHDQGTVFSFTQAKTLTAAFRGTYSTSAHGADAASHTDPGRGRGPRRGAPPAPAAA